MRFRIDRILSDEQLDYIRDLIDPNEFRCSEITDKKAIDFRISMSQWLNPLECVDISSSLVKHANLIDNNINIVDHSSAELQIVTYQQGGKFKKHQDVIAGKVRERLYTSITLLHRSENLVGGDLRLFESLKDPNYIRLNLNVGDTAVFHASTYHECTELLEGTRQILVGWIRLRK